MFASSNGSAFVGFMRGRVAAVGMSTRGTVHVQFTFLC